MSLAYILTANLNSCYISEQMDILKYVFISILLTCLFALSAFCLTCNVEKITELYTCKSISNDQKPIEISSTFSEDSNIYCSFKSNVSEVRLSYKVIRIGEEDIRPAFAEGSMHPIFDEYIGLEIKYSYHTWGEGIYKIILFIDDKQEASITFTIE